MVSQKILHPMMQKIEIRFTSLSELRNLDSSALHPDLSILWNTSIFHRIAYQVSFSMASLSVFTGRLVISFHTIRSRPRGVPRSIAWMTVNVRSEQCFH